MRWLCVALLCACGSSNKAAPDAPYFDAPADAPDASGTVAFTNLHANQEVETGFAIGTGAGEVPAVACQFDGAPPVVATGTTSWRCPLPSWRLGSSHVVTVGVWDGLALHSPVSVTVYAAHNHDFNGDGYADLAIGAGFASSNAGTVSIFYGSPTGIAATADLTILAPTAASMFGFSLASADLRGTGYADLVVGVASYSTSHADTGHIYMFNGGASGLPATPSYSLAGPALADAAAQYMIAVGDYTGDGLDDVVVGYGGYNTFAGQVFFYKGGAGGIAFDTMMTGTTGKDLGSYVGLADVYGTGYAAVVIGRSGGTDVYAASATGIATTSSATYTDTGAINTLFTRHNGYADIAITGNAQATIYYGSITGPSTLGTTVTDPPQFGWGTVVPGDIDLDGHDDIVFANPCLDSSCVNGSILVFPGSDAGISTTSTATLTNPGTGSEYGYSLGAADLNGDGRLDLAVGTNAQYVYVYAGNSSTLFPSSPTTTINGLFDAAFSPR